MTNISKSPDRNTFQKEAYIKRQTEKGEPLNQDYLGMWDTTAVEVLKREADPEWQKDNLEYDLRTSEKLCAKVKASDQYAQNLYAALCNRSFLKNEVIPILKDDSWSCSWRYAGGIVADMREEGDYIDWYCSGIGDGLGNGDSDGTKNYVGESVVTEEIESDLKDLGWIVLDIELDN